MEILEKIKNQIAEFDKKRQDLLAELKNDFSPMLKPLFEKHKKIKSIGWTQYTPYFNDGEECTFGVHNDELYVNWEREDDVEALNDKIYVTVTKGNQDACLAFATEKKLTWYKCQLGSTSPLPNNNMDAELAKGLEEFKELLQSIPESFYKDLFGDHNLITVNSDGSVDVEQYKHD